MLWFFFLFKQKTAYEMRISDWSSDVCSSDLSDFDGYVDTLTPNGRTYHDIGLIWGARLISPTGLFASENATTARGGEIQRHVIFMTDRKSTRLNSSH